MNMNDYGINMKFDILRGQIQNATTPSILTKDRTWCSWKLWRIRVELFNHLSR